MNKIVRRSKYFLVVLEAVLKDGEVIFSLYYIHCHKKEYDLGAPAQFFNLEGLKNYYYGHVQEGLSAYLQKAMPTYGIEVLQQIRESLKN